MLTYMLSCFQCDAGSEICLILLESFSRCGLISVKVKVLLKASGEQTAQRKETEICLVGPVLSMFNNKALLLSFAFRTTLLNFRESVKQWGTSFKLLIFQQRMKGLIKM